MRHTLLLFALALAAQSATFAQPGGWFGRGRVVHDPMLHDPVMAKEDDTYYLYYTGRNISSLSSSNLSEWTILGGVFTEAPRWAMDSIPEYRGHTWAPDIIFYKGAYHLFYSCSAFGKNTSAIGHASRSTLDPDADEPWKDTGAVVVSHTDDNFNAIDPCVTVDDNGTPWMAFGSFWGGIQLMRLTDDMTAVSPWQEMINLCTRKYEGGVPMRDNTVEAPFIFRHGAYYYLFVSYDYCCRGLRSDYKVVVGRSSQITGPYIDKDGRAMTRGGGTLVADSNDDYVAIGHSAAYHLDGKDYFMAHGYSRSDEGRSHLFLCEMTWDDEEWPVLKGLQK